MLGSTLSERSSFVKKVFGSCHHARDGVNIAVSCPSCGHSSRKKKFSINLETWQCHCWVCGLKAKTLLPILKKFYSDTAYPQEYASVFLGKDSLDYGKPDREEDTLRLPGNFKLFIDNTNSKDPNVRACLKYLFSRGLTRKDLWYFKLGYSDSSRFKRRVIMPSFDFSGELNFFVARSIDSSSRLKYINCNVNKTDIIFNEINIDWKREVTITEGPFDLIKSNKNSTCLLGSNLSTSSLLFSKIARHRSPVLLALDRDMSEKSQKIAELLSRYDCNVRILDLLNHSDVGEMTRNEFLNLRGYARTWGRGDSLISKIRSIESGSLV